MSETGSERNPIDVLAEEFVARYRRGERPALTEYAERCPELADEIRDLFPALVMMEDAIPATPDDTRDVGTARLAVEGQSITRVGDFRILREVGRGGMGIVYEAEQESLGRHVALKVLPNHALLDSKRLLRFQREARAAAKLHHTNIVPVFGVGETDGLHYYVMQFIRGIGLDQVLAELQNLRDATSAPPQTLTRPPGSESLAQSLLTGRFVASPDPVPAEVRLPGTGPASSGTFRPDGVVLPGSGESSTHSGTGGEYWRSIARVGVQVAEALAYAHSQGVLHRDIKPSNLLLDTHGTVWVADFGLAKAAGTDDLTHTGDLLGTLRYMAPERFDGQGDHRADVYALGLTVYELLTLKPAFAAENRGKLIQEVTAAAPPKPRSINPAIPRDLETIVLKTIARDPALRYQSAAALTEDLKRFLEDRPIRARRASRREQAWRWCRRNPAVASLIGAVFTLLTLVTVGALVAAVRIDEARREAFDDATAQSAAREIAQAEAARKDRELAQLATRSAKEQRLHSLIFGAQASRFSHRVGQRFATLDTIRQAVGLARELERPQATFDELRNLAVAAMAMPDFRADTAWISSPTEGDKVWGNPAPDPACRRMAIEHQLGAVSIRRIGTGPDDCGEIVRLPGLGNEVRVQWAPDGRFLAVWHWQSRRLQVWRLETDKPAIAMEIPADCQGVEFTPDGRHLIVMEHAVVWGAMLRRVVARFYALDTGRPVRAVWLPEGAADRIAHHPTRPELAIGLPGRVVCLDLTSGKELRSLPSIGCEVLAWHPSGELLSVVGPQHVEIWDVPYGRRNWQLSNTGGGTVAAFNKSGDLLVTNGWAGRMRLWNPYTGREVLNDMGYSKWFGPGDRLASPFPGGGNDSAGPLTIVDAGREYRTFAVGTGQGTINGLGPCSIHPNGRLLAVACSQGFGLIDLSTGSERAFVPGTLCRDVLFEPDGSLLVRFSNGLFRWPVTADPGDANRLQVGPPELVPVLSRNETVARSADGTVLATSAGPYGASVWRRDRPYDALRLPHSDCRHVAVSPDGKLVATGAWGGRGIKVWDANTGQLIRFLLPELGTVMPRFSPDGKWLYDWRGQGWRLADWTDGPKPPAGTTGVGFSPDGRLAAWVGKGFLALTDAATGRELCRLEDPHQDGLRGVTFSPDGTLLIGSTEDNFCVRAWDLLKLREGLKSLDLDWDSPPYPPRPALDTDAPPLQLGVIGQQLLGDPRQMAQYESERLMLTLWLNPFDPESRIALGERLVGTRKYAQAIPHLTAAIAFRPEQTGAYRLRALAHHRSGKWEAVVADASAVLARNPSDITALDLRGDALARLGKHREAIVDFTKLIEQYPDDAELYDLRAASYEALGEQAKADADRSQSLRLPSDQPLVMNNQAWRLVTGSLDTRDPKRALELISRAINVQPGNPLFLNTLGVVQYRNALYTQAIETLNKSLVAGKGGWDAFDLYFLSMCYARLGDKSKARECYDRAGAWAEMKAKVLTAQHAAELGQFRTEAAELLGLK